MIMNPTIRLPECIYRKLESKAFVAGGENYNAPIQRVDDFLNNRKSTYLGDVKPSIGPNYEFSNLNEIFFPNISALQWLRAL